MWSRELQSVLDPRGRIWGPNTAKKGMEGQNFFPTPTLVTESPGELGQRSTRQEARHASTSRRELGCREEVEVEASRAACG